MSSHCSVAGKQQKLSISTDRIIYIQLVQRQLDNKIKIETLNLYHEALLLVTGKAEFNKNSQEIQYHICELMADSVVHAYGIQGMQNLTLKTDQELVTNIDDGEFVWTRPIKGKFICNQKLTVDQVKQKMLNVVGNKGSYHFYSNNCQRAAKYTYLWISQLEDDSNQLEKIDETILNQFQESLNYKVLIKIFEIKIPYFLQQEIRDQHQIILVYLTGDVRKWYYQNKLKIDKTFQNYQFLTYVALYSTQDGYYGRYFDDYDSLDVHYKKLCNLSLNHFENTLNVYEGSGAENNDGSKLKYAVKDAIKYKYEENGSIIKLYQDRWNSKDFVDYLKKNLEK